MKKIYTLLVLRALYVDLNSFFASCEQQNQPLLRNRPVAVVPLIADTTFVIAASYEAKAYGVKTGTRVGDAKKMCPGLQLVCAGHSDYVKYHHKVKTAIETVIPIRAVRSIDEFACELTGSQQQEEKARQLALKIKEVLHHNVGAFIKASIGIAPNFLLAKIAADMQKPNGLTILDHNNLHDRLIRLKLQDIPGIGPRMEARLNIKNITNMEQLLQCSEQHTRGLWENVWGARMHRLLKGDWLDFSEDSPVKSIGHQHVLPPQKRNFTGGLLVSQKLLWKAAVRLRAKNMMARKMYLSIRLTDGERFFKEISFHPTQDSGFLLQKLKEMYQATRGKKPRKISVTLFDFVKETEQQLSFFENDNRNRIYKAVDAINQRYGRNTVFSGSLLDDKNTAPTRIAFQRIPGLDEVD
ncbi:MAG: DNA-directed DNA polymerase [Bdellovibrionaceae bacterium]|nr:DNA-directed DNA polymerase [Pseudobdellovibrionaceae bacterium]